MARSFSGMHVGLAAVGGLVVGAVGTVLFQRMRATTTAAAGQAVTWLGVQFPWDAYGRVNPTSAFYQPDHRLPGVYAGVNPYPAITGYPAEGPSLATMQDMNHNAARFYNAPVSMRARIR